MRSAGQRLALLRAIALKGTARPGRIAAALGTPPEVTATELVTLADAEMLTVSTAGISLTSGDGKSSRACSPPSGAPSTTRNSTASTSSSARSTTASKS